MFILKKYRNWQLLCIYTLFVCKTFDLPFPKCGQNLTAGIGLFGYVSGLALYWNFEKESSFFQNFQKFGYDGNIRYLREIIEWLLHKNK